MSTEVHFNSAEFELAERIWHSSEEKSVRLRAISFYKLACKKNDARAFLALYKINSERHNGWLITGRVHDGRPYLDEALHLGYLPALLYAGSEVEEHEPYERLIYLATGMFAAREAEDPSLADFQKAFLLLSENFAKEFLPEILQLGQDWTPGTPVEIANSPLNGQLIEHPNKYKPELYAVRAGWEIFPAKNNLDEYFEQLTGNEEYCLASKAAEINDLALRDFHLRKAARSKHGQAMYALREWRTFSLLDAAIYGSPDAFEDLMDLNSEISDDRGFTNTATLSRTKDRKYLDRIDCLVYLYTLLERLGLGDRDFCFVDVECLSTETESGYTNNLASIRALKYQLCDHDHVVAMNERAHKWELGKAFDSEIMELLGAGKST